MPVALNGSLMLVDMRKPDSHGEHVDVKVIKSQ